MIRSLDTQHPVLGELGRILACLALAFLVVTLLALGFAGLGHPEPGGLARKFTVPGFILLYIVICRLKTRQLPGALGFSPAPRSWWTVILRGFCGGTVSLLLLVLVLLATGHREVRIERTPLEIVGRALFYVVTLVAVLGLLEEGLFRGLLYRRLHAAGGSAAAIGLGSVLFALAHFMRPGKGRPVAGFEGAWDVVPGALSGLSEIGMRWKEVLGLLLVGLVLAFLRRATGTVYASIGVHAGWVWLRKMDAGVTDEVGGGRIEAPWYIGTNRFYDGLLGWCALLLTLFLVRWLVRGTGQRDPETTRDSVY